MDEALLDEYRKLKLRRKGAEASLAIGRFAASFASEMEREVWVRTNLPTLAADGARLPHELFTQVVLPVLLAGRDRHEPFALLWMVKLADNFHSDMRLATAMNYAPVAILDELLEAAPDHVEARLLRLDAAIDWLRFCVHEWPAGILYGMNGATLAECGEIRAEVAVARRIDVDKRFADFLDGFEAKLSEYEERLA
jgi:hypothetical protein